LEFTFNRALFKIFGPLSKDTYRDICKYFSVDAIEELFVRVDNLSQSIVRQKAMNVGRFLTYDSRV